ncbi:MAG: hypothetical protein EOO14_21255 [Chitinophagaceae bacterium]|nr:MAG: hypothetical protein EOO14_21255 [Chitinophagaceae bacterium]
MKPVFFIAACLLTALLTNAQKLEQYCEMTAQNKLFSRKVTIDVDYGEERKWVSFKDNRLKDEMGKVKSFNSTVDALNFMGRAGWKLVNAFLVTESSTSVYHYVLKREFDKSELAEDQVKN